MSERKRGKSLPPETRTKMSVAQTGRSVPEKTRAKLRGDKNPSKRADVRAKLREQKLGKRNPSYDKRWFVNVETGETRFIVDLPGDGWKYGRKL